MLAVSKHAYDSGQRRRRHADSNYRVNQLHQFDIGNSFILPDRRTKNAKYQSRTFWTDQKLVQFF